MSPWTVYWITRLDSMSVLFTVIFLTLLIVGGVVLLVGTIETDGQWIKVPGLRKFAIIGVSIFLFAGLGSMLLPSTKEAIAIYALPKIVNNEQVQQIPENAVNLINEQMKAWLDDLRGKEDK